MASPQSKAERSHLYTLLIEKQPLPYTIPLPADASRWGAELRGEPLAVAEQAGHQPVVERPQLLEAVLQRRPGQREPLVRADHPDALRDRRKRVLHRLRPVQNPHLVVAVEQRVAVPIEQRIGRDDQVVIRILANRSAPPPQLVVDRPMSVVIILRPPTPDSYACILSGSSWPEML